MMRPMSPGLHCLAREWPRPPVATSPRTHGPLIPAREELRASAHFLCQLPPCYMPVPPPSRNGSKSNTESLGVTRKEVPFRPRRGQHLTIMSGSIVEAQLPHTDLRGGTQRPLRAPAKPLSLFLGACGMNYPFPYLCVSRFLSSRALWLRIPSRATPCRRCAPGRALTTPA
jgi:hypothetical protein